MIHNSKIFLDGGDPKETKEMMSLLGGLDGQTTNPTLIAKNPDAQKRLAEGKKFTSKEILDFYRSIVTELSGLIPTGSISIEVYADKNTTAEEMLKQAREMWKWIPNAHIKFPTTHVGLAAAEQLISEGGRVNMTLVFTQEQAAAVHAATRGAKKGDVFVSPFVGRLDDIGENGMDLIKNIRQMYDEAGSHVELLAASIRSLDHFLYSLALRSDILTAPAKAIKLWVEAGKSDSKGYQYDAKGLKPIPYKKLDLSKKWREFDISHPLTDKGIEKFAADWNTLIV
ncbi:MAG: transaldolase family protein [bacterium]|nr:transaldolase family protein [bacterium]